MLNNTKIFNDYTSEETINIFTDIMNQKIPLFFSRIGGSDYDTVFRYFNNKNLINDINFCNKSIERVKTYNGYFDFDNDINNFRKYLDDMLSYYKNSDDVTYCCQYLIDQFDNNIFNQDDRIFLDYILDGKKAIHYSFIETVQPLLKSFTNWGKNKKILIVSPFSKSIEYQFKNKDNLYLNYRFPDFELLTYNTKITYNSVEDSKNSLNIETNNWHEECLRISNGISKIDFDIALLSCASYSMFLGNFIKYNLHKKSIYLGGIINVFFNIYGGRFQESFYNLCGLNLKYQIDPFENDDILNIKGGRNNGNTESLSAYFGKKIK